MELAAKLAILEQIKAKIAGGDIAGLASVIHPDFVMHEDPGVAYGGVYRGPEGFVQLIGAVVAHWRDLAMEELHILDEPGKTGVQLIVRMTGRNAAGEALEARTSEFWRFEGDRLIEGQVWYYDTPSLASLAIAPAQVA